MTDENRKLYFELLKEKHKSTDWNDFNQIKEYNRYVRELREMLEEDF